MAEQANALPEDWAQPRRRSSGVLIQIAIVVVIVGLICGATFEASQNLARAHIASGFGFWNNTAGFDISQTLIPYSASTSTFGRAFWVGLLNTLLVAALGIVLATVLGFAIGLARLSRNWLVAKLAGGYVEGIRNVPLLLQLFFWYNAVLRSLPQMRGAVPLPGGVILNNRGLFLPRPQFGSDFSLVIAAFAAGVIAAVAWHVYATYRRNSTGAALPVVWPPFALII